LLILLAALALLAGWRRWSCPCSKVLSRNSCCWRIMSPSSSIIWAISSSSPPSFCICPFGAICMLSSIACRSCSAFWHHFA